MSNGTVVRMKITLDDVTPAVSRTLEVPLHIRLDRLHAVIQTAFSWTDSHLWEMSFGQTGFGIPDPEYGFNGPLDARKATLAQILADTRRKTSDISTTLATPGSIASRSSASARQART